MVGAVEAREGVKLKNQFQLLECDDVDYRTPVIGGEAREAFDKIERYRVQRCGRSEATSFGG